MSDLQASITIRRPIADVFAFVADARNIPCWHADTAEVHLLSGDGRYRFEVVPAGTRVTFTEDLRLRGLFRLLRPLVRHQVGQTARANFARLRALLEQPTPVAG